jgi:hypothetical protein
VNAPGNYWGHPSGPTHPDNPGGQGDRIREIDASWNVITGVVSYAGWLPSHHCNEVDLSVAGLEVVQSIQDLNNSVPLVAGKPTVVRIYADSGMAPEVGGVPVELKAYRNGSLLGSKQGTITARPITDWDAVRAGEEGGLGIRLDSTWLSGRVTLTVELNAQHTISESTFSNNQVTRTLTYTERKPLHIGLAPIEYRPLPSMEPRMPLTEELPSLVQFLHKAYPVSDVRVTLLPPVWWPFMMKGSDSEVPRRRQLLRELTYGWSFYHRAGVEPGQSLDQIVGVFPADCEVGGDITTSESDPRWLGGKGLASYMCSGDGGILAHEVAHNLGLYHPCSQAQAANCCQAWHPGPPSTPPPDWPYGNASIQEYGFDTIEGAAVLRATPDMMTYCEPKWLSPHHYKKLFRANGAPQPPVAAPPGGSLHQTGAGTYLLVGGLVDITGTVAFDPFWQLTAAQPALDPLEGSDYCLELWDAQTVLQSRCFDLSFYDYESGEEIAVDGFVTAMPLDPAASRVVLKQGDTELDEVVASAYTPTVTLLAPNTTVLQTGHITVTWTAADADPGDELAFVLSYSNDNGATWLPFALNLTGTTSLALDLSNVPGGEACRVKVDASDGWHNASDASETFPVAGKAPVAGITAPADGAVVAVPLTLQGYGYDLEDGQLSGAALQWSSDVDGPLGSGDTLWDLNLTPGQHTLMLQVTDSQGHTGTASVVITVQGGGPVLEEIYLPCVLRRY